MSASALTGGHRFDPFLNEYVGEITEANTTSGQAIDLKKPLHIDFLPNNNFKEAVLVNGEMSVSLNAAIGRDLSVGDSIITSNNISAGGHISGDKFLTISDSREKTNINDIGNVDLSMIRVTKYLPIRNSTRETYGVIAQEIINHDLTKNMVFWDPDRKRYRVDYIQFIPLLIKENQQFRDKINHLYRLGLLFSCASLTALLTLIFANVRFVSKIEH